MTEKLTVVLQDGSRPVSYAASGVAGALTDARPTLADVTHVHGDTCERGTPVRTRVAMSYRRLNGRRQKTAGGFWQSSLYESGK